MASSPRRPAYHWTGITAGFVQNQQAIYPSGDLDAPVLTADTLELLGSSILAACDDDDGVVDGAMTDPRRCEFTPANLPRCSEEVAAAGCVTAAQLAAIERVYEGPTRRVSRSTAASTTAARTTLAGGTHGSGQRGASRHRCTERPVRVRDGAVQVPSSSATRVGLHGVRLRWPRTTGPTPPSLNQRRSERLPRPRRKDHLLDRLVGSGADARGDHRLLRAAAGRG